MRKNLATNSPQIALVTHICSVLTLQECVNTVMYVIDSTWDDQSIKHTKLLS
jgi:hypothetical protein